MFSNPTSVIRLVASATTGTASRRLALVLAAVLWGSASAALAVQYDFLTVAGTGIGNSTATTFTSPNTGEYITVRHHFPSGGVVGVDVGTQDNDNAAIFPSQFLATFPGTGQVQGHLLQTIYSYRSVTTFNLLNYPSLSTSTIFGMWNTSDEVTAGLSPVYQIQLFDGSTQVNPTTLQVYNKQDNETQVQGRREMLMNPSTGEITFGGFVNGGAGVHTNAAFWYNIPVGTEQIIVYADLPPLNTIGDGVGFYFAEIHVPEPTSFAIAILGLFSLGMFGNRRNR